MLGKSENAAKSGRLLVTIAAVAVDPTGLAAVGAGLDAYLHAHEALFQRHPGLAKLARETQSAFDAELKTKRYDKPANARALLPQMLERALPTGADYVEHGLDHAPILVAMVSRLDDPEHKRPEMIGAFKALYGPLLEQVCNDPRLEAVLRPALTRDRLRREKQSAGILQDVLARLGGLEGALADPNAASFGDLCALAAQFEETDFNDKAQVTQFLSLKAEEYRAYRKQIERIDERTAGLGNLKAAARDAAERLDFEEVEAMLSRVHQVEVEIASETAELRAQNALLRGRVDQAYHLLCAAADSFAAIDPLEPARRRILDYNIRLKAHARRFGGAGYHASARMLAAALSESLRQIDAELWASGQNSQGITLQEQGIRTGGAPGAALLGQAVDAYRAALTVYTQDQHPVDWATTQNNLGTALRNQGSRTGGARGAALLGQAVDAYRAALTVYTQDQHPVAWATTQNNLGNALQAQGSRTGGAQGAALLGQAVDAYRAALAVRTEGQHPVDWAMTQNNLGTALRNQGSRTGGAGGAALLGQAVDAYRAALIVYTQDQHPVAWATTQNNLGAVLQEQGSRTGGAQGAALLGQAVDAYRAALTVRTQDQHPVAWATTQNNLGNALQDQGSRTGGAEGAVLLGQAVDAYRAALTVRTEGQHPVDWATTQNNLGTALRNQGSRTGGAGGAALLGQAVDAYRAALTVRTEGQHPVDWAATQNNLGNALQDQGSRTGGAEGAALLGQAVEAYRAALTVRTEGQHPVDWAMTQENLAIAEQAIADHVATADPAPHLAAALTHVEAALTVFDPQHMPYNFDKATALRDALRARIGGPAPP